MGDLVAILWPAHHERLCEGICRLFNAKVGCDFEISLNDDPNPIRAHWLILQIFCQALTNCDSKQLRFEDDSEISRDDLRCLIEFIYRGKTYVVRQNLERLRIAAEKMGLHVFLDVINQLTRNSNGNVDEEVNAVNISRTEEEHNYGIKRKTESENDQNKVVVLSSDEMVNFIPKEDEESKGEHFEIIEDSYLENTAESSEVKLSDEPTNAFSQTEMIYVCPICDKVLIDKYKFSFHLKSHSEPNAYLQCPHCPFRSRRLQAHLAARHQKDMKGNLLEKSFKCDECDYSCVANFLLKYHKKLRHKERCHKCDECSVSFLCNSELVRHKKQVHSNERPFMCDSCGSCFKTAKCLRAHNEIHVGVKWVCDVCGVKVSQTGVWRHKQLHLEGGTRKKFKCPLCRYPFRQKYNLKVHIKGKHKVSDEELEAMMNSELINIPEDEMENAESEISRFKEKGKKRKVSPEKEICSVCDLILSSKPALYRHMKQHKDGTLVKRFKCPLCGFTTMEKHNLKCHLKGKHKMQSEDVNEIAKNISSELPRVGSESEDANEEESSWG